MVTRLGRTRELAKGFTDGTPIKDRADLPPVEGALSSRRRPRQYRTPNALTRPIWLARVVLRHAFTPVKPAALRSPEAHLAFADARWWVVPNYDSVLVSNAEGSAALLHRRDPATFRRMLVTSIVLRARIIARWPQLRAAYRAALPRITSEQEWARSFGLTKKRGTR